MSLGDIFLPFIHCPYSTSVKTSSYTIPSGYYAVVTLFVYNTLAENYITFDGNTVIRVSSDSDYNLNMTAVAYVAEAVVINGSGNWYATVSLFKKAV